MKSSALLDEFGEHPHEFFWVLQPNHPNPNLNLERQRSVWGETLARFDWFTPYREADLVLTTDNGDLVFDMPHSVLVVNPRSDEIEEHHVSLVDFVRQARHLESKILPDDL